MKVLGIQLKTKEIILVVLIKGGNGEIVQTSESDKFEVFDIYNTEQVRQFSNQMQVALKQIKPDVIGIYKRNENAKGKMTPSAASFKWEGIIQLVSSVDIRFVSPQTLSAYFKKNKKTIAANMRYQGDAFDVAYYLLSVD